MSIELNPIDTIFKGPQKKKSNSWKNLIVRKTANHQTNTGNSSEWLPVQSDVSALIL